MKAPFYCDVRSNRHSTYAWIFDADGRGVFHLTDSNALLAKSRALQAVELLNLGAQRRAQDVQRSLAPLRIVEVQHA